MSNESIQAKQDACATVESKALEFLMQYTPAEALTVGDVKQIASQLRHIAFDVYLDFEPPKSTQAR